MGKPRLPVYKKERSKGSQRSLYSPIDLEQTAEQVSNDVTEGLSKLFDENGLRPTMQGWRALALHLIEKHGEFKFKQRFKAEPFWFAMWEMHQACKAKPGKTHKVIATEIASRFGLKPQTLAVRYSDKDKKELERYNPYRMRFPDWGQRGAKYAHAMYEAPRRITLLE